MNCMCSAGVNLVVSDFGNENQPLTCIQETFTEVQKDNESFCDQLISKRKLTDCERKPMVEFLNSLYIVGGKIEIRNPDGTKLIKTALQAFKDSI